jgi:hypothetical protein
MELRFSRRPLTGVCALPSLLALCFLALAFANSAAAAGKTPIVTDLGGQTLTPGVYNSASSIGLTGVLTLDGRGNSDSVFVFQAGSTLTTATASEVKLINGAKSCNVFWQVGSSATLGTYSIIRGNVLALASITVTTGVTVDGRALARDAAVTLDTDTITRPTCDQPAVPTTTSLATSANPATASQPVTFTATVAASTGTAVPTGLVVFVDRWELIGVVTLDSTGHAALPTTTLTVGLHLIKAVYLGNDSFLDSRSRRLYELVQPDLSLQPDLNS